MPAVARHAREMVGQQRPVPVEVQTVMLADVGRGLLQCQRQVAEVGGEVVRRSGVREAGQLSEHGDARGPVEHAETQRGQPETCPAGSAQIPTRRHHHMPPACYLPQQVGDVLDSLDIVEDQQPALVRLQPAHRPCLRIRQGRNRVQALGQLRQAQTYVLRRVCCDPPHQPIPVGVRAGVMQNQLRLADPTQAVHGCLSYGHATCTTSQQPTQLRQIAADEHPRRQWQIVHRSPGVVGDPLRWRQLCGIHLDIGLHIMVADLHTPAARYGRATNPGAHCCIT